MYVAKNFPIAASAPAAPAALRVWQRPEGVTYPKNTFPTPAAASGRSGRAQGSGTGPAGRIDRKNTFPKPASAPSAPSAGGATVRLQSVTLCAILRIRGVTHALSLSPHQRTLR